MAYTRKKVKSRKHRTVSGYRTKKGTRVKGYRRKKVHATRKQRTVKR